MLYAYAYISVWERERQRQRKGDREHIQFFIEKQWDKKSGKLKMVAYREREEWETVWGQLWKLVLSSSILFCTFNPVAM